MEDARAGSGHFEAGQCDVVVADTHIEATSVVLVTLIGNPGPVVVQYVSLLPQEGFTVHLTAPAAGLSGSEPQRSPIHRIAHGEKERGLRSLSTMCRFSVSKFERLLDEFLRYHSREPIAEVCYGAFGYR